MSRSSLWWLILPGVLLVVVAVQAVEPRHDLGNDDPLAMYPVPPELLARSAELTAAQEVVRDHIAIKERMIQLLIEGQFTLDEVTTAFLQLNREFSCYLAVIRKAYVGHTDEERHARNVIAYAMDRVRSPEEKEILGCRLGCEFTQRYGVTP